MSQYTDDMQPKPGEDNTLHDPPGAIAYRDLREESGGEFLKRVGTDGSEWATEFVLRFPGSTDIDTARAWFANAIEAGISAGYSRVMDGMHQTAKKLGVDLTNVWTPEHAARVFYDKSHPRFTQATELAEYLTHLNDIGLETDVAILDENNIVWLTYGEERSSGGEDVAFWLVNGDPVEGMEDDEQGGWEYEPAPLSRAAYPVRLLFDPLAS